MEEMDKEGPALTGLEGEERQHIIDLAARALNATEDLAQAIGAVGYFNRGRDIMELGQKVREHTEVVLQRPKRNLKG